MDILAQAVADGRCDAGPSHIECEHTDAELSVIELRAMMADTLDWEE